MFLIENSVEELRYSEHNNLETIEQRDSTIHEQDIAIRGLELDVRHLDESIKKQDCVNMKLKSEIENLQGALREKVNRKKKINCLNLVHLDT